MRSELTTLEQIDMYLSGNLPPAEHAAFEAKINADPGLKNTVNQQKELIKAVNRKALRAQINAAAAAGAGGGGMSNLWIGIGSVVGVGLLTASIIYFNSEDETVIEHENLVQNDTEIVLNDSSIVNFVPDDETLILEEPETIYSSVQTYEKPDSEQMNVAVDFDSETEEQENVVENETEHEGVLKEVVTDPAVTETTESELVIGTNRTRRASYPGGNYAMDQFMDQNLHYPRSARNKRIEGVVRCEFFVTADGLITEINAKCTKMSEADGPAFNDVKMLLNKKIMNAFVNNATHILRTMPNWEPAKNSQGNPILSRQRIYFNYDLEKGCLVYQLDDVPFTEESELKESSKMDKSREK